MSEFNAQTWLNQVVRGSNYRVPIDAPDYGALDFPPHKIADALIKVTDHASDDISGFGMLAPPRIPLDTPIPAVLMDVFGLSMICDNLASRNKQVHPAVIHALLACAIEYEGPNRDRMFNAVAPLFTSMPNHQSYYQPTLTQAVWLHPDWFARIRNRRIVKPSLSTGKAKITREKGGFVSVILRVGDTRVNPSQILTFPSRKTLDEALYPDEAKAFGYLAETGLDSNTPIFTSLWITGLGRKESVWKRMLPGAAIFSPFITRSEIAALAGNMLAKSDAGAWLRMGAGISDIWPVDNDAVLSNYVDMRALLNAPPSTPSWISLLHHATHPGTSFTIPKEWFKNQSDRILIAVSIGLGHEKTILSDQRLMSLMDNAAVAGYATADTLTQIRDIIVHKQSADQVYDVCQSGFFHMNEVDFFEVPEIPRDTTTCLLPGPQ